MQLDSLSNRNQQDTNEVPPDIVDQPARELAENSQSMEIDLEQ